MTASVRTWSLASANQNDAIYLPAFFGAQVGDVVLHASLWGNVTVTVPSGWTTVLNTLVDDHRVVLAHKTLADTTTQFFVASASSPMLASHVWVQDTPGINVQAHQTDTSATTATAPGVTTTEQALLIAYWLGITDVAEQFPLPGGMTSIDNQGSSTHPSFRVASEDFPTPGATGSRTSTPASSAAAERVGWLVALKSQFPVNHNVGMVRMN